MPSHPPASPARSRTPLGGSLLALRTGFREVTLRVQRMHLAVAGLTFRVLRRVPVVSVPARVVERAHDAVSGGVYAAVRGGGDAALAAAAAAERALGSGRADGALGLRSAASGAFGDHLAAAGNPLALVMELRAEDGRVVTADGETGADTGAVEGGGTICVFLHGLGCSEAEWRDTARADGHYGARLRAELGLAPLYLRYNTGLPVADNAARFAALLERVAAAHPGRDLVLVGHSMGGLVARSACRWAAARGMAWAARTRLVVCLGAPHRGAPLEKAGAALAAALALHPVTRPLAEVADARSAGVRDLRHGLLADDAAAWPLPPGVPCRLLGASLHRDADHPLGWVLGDGLVTLGSATAPALRGDVRSERLGGLGHMRLLNEPRVYARLRAWVAEAVGGGDVAAG